MRGRRNLDPVFVFLMLTAFICIAVLSAIVAHVALQ